MYLIHGKKNNYHFNELITFQDWNFLDIVQKLESDAVMWWINRQSSSSFFVIDFEIQIKSVLPCQKVVVWANLEQNYS